jgi:6-phosphogluconate dehydrogenase
MSAAAAQLGIVGLGVMGQNLALNFADHGFRVAVYNRTPEKTREFLQRLGPERGVVPAFDLDSFIGLLAAPRIVLLMVSAGPAVDDLLDRLSPRLAPGDVVLDGGNSHFQDTQRRAAALAAQGLKFLGLGISGGELGARYGPCLMPGGDEAGYAVVRPLLEKVAARVNGEPCVAYLGPGAAGHFVKMVHNGIEYALEQLLAEAYDLLHRGLGLNYHELADIFTRFNEGALKSYLVEITGQIFRRRDPETGQPLVALIRDIAGQKGTGIWTSKAALDLGVPIPTIDTAVALRHLSARWEERQAAAGLLPGPGPFVLRETEGRGFIDKMGQALYAGMVTAFAQGLALLRRASEAYGYGLHLETVARLWREGCIIRAALLEDIRAAFQNRAALPNILLDKTLAGKLAARQGAWREVVKTAVAWGIPAPALMASLAYVDAFRSSRLPANLIQAQRDYFGAHTYERVDRPGVFHTDWLMD